MELWAPISSPLNGQNDEKKKCGRSGVRRFRQRSNVRTDHGISRAKTIDGVTNTHVVPNLSLPKADPLSCFFFDKKRSNDATPWDLRHTVIDKAMLPGPLSEAWCSLTSSRGSHAQHAMAPARVLRPTRSRGKHQSLGQVRMFHGKPRYFGRFRARKP